MNAVISLCNFCELHGPSILFCTQAFHDMESSSVSGFEKTKNEKPLPRREWYGPRYFNDKSNPTTVPFKKDGCEGCTSMTPECRGYISSDHEARVSYVSSQFPLHPDVFSLVRQACVRSLSCEVCPGGEGPIYFGDDDRGHVISYTFFLKDSQARGFQSWYSIIIVSTDKVLLLNSWPFLVKNFENIGSELQRKAFENFRSEQLSNDLKALRLDSVTRMNLDAFRRQRGNVKARSIKSLITVDVFLYIHSQFTWILKAGAYRISERLFEGFPNEENNEVDLENQEEVEDGFIKVHIKKIINDNSSCDKNNDGKDVKQDVSDNELEFKSIKELYFILGYDQFHILAYHTLIGTLIIIQSKYLSLAKSIILCLRILLPQSCFNPIYSSNTYEVPDNCNFVTIPSNVNIPDNIKKSRVFVEIDIPTKDTVTLKDVILNIECNIEPPEKPPQMLAKIEKIIISEEFPLQAIDTFLFTQKKIWTNIAKVLSTFFRIRPRSTEEVKKMYNAHRIQDCDESLLKFWMNSLSSTDMI